MTTPTPTNEPELAFRVDGFSTLVAGPGLCRAGRDRVSISSPPAASSRRRCPIASCASGPSTWHARLAGSGLERGDRVAIVAETSPDFVTMFFACQYAGLVPVPLPLCINIGGHDAYVERLRGMLAAAGARLAVAPADLAGDAGRGRRRHRRRLASPRPPRSATWPASARAGRAARARRALLHPVLLRQHQLPARRAGHAAGDRRQRARDRRARAGPAPRRSLHLLAAALPRHGPGRLLPDAGDGADHRRLPADHGVRPPAAAVAQAAVRPRRDDLVRADLRLRAVHAPRAERRCPRASTCRGGGSPASAAR